MQVQQVMTPAPSACAPGTNLCEAVQLMWEGDFGALPVVDDGGVVLGIVTDRDISVALGTRNQVPAQLTVADVMSKTVLTCHGHDDVRAALNTMGAHRVRRLPVVDGEQRLCGMLSINDAILAVDGPLRADDVVETLRGICTHTHLPEKGVVIAA